MYQTIGVASDLRLLAFTRKWIIKLELANICEVFVKLVQQAFFKILELFLAVISCLKVDLRMLRWAFLILFEQLIDLVFKLYKLKPATHQSFSFFEGSFLSIYFLQAKEATLHLVCSVFEFVKEIVPWIVLADVK